jgi:hypothetical protein
VSISRDDLRAAVQAGVLTEAQAAGMLALAGSRAGRRAARAGDEGRFEFCRGFAEVFVLLGLILLLAGAAVFAAPAGAGPLLPAVVAALCWLMARDFTRRRRMSLPSIVLAAGFGMGAAGTIGWALSERLGSGASPVVAGVLFGLAGMAAMAASHRAFRVPFAMFVLGLFGLAALFVVTAGIRPQPADAGFRAEVFDLRHSSGLAFGTLLSGLAAFAGAMWFDLRDPHRLGRTAASGFRLHPLAAPAPVNTVALTVLDFGGAAGYLLTAAALAAVALLALGIDRRSVLTPGLVHPGIVLAWALCAGGDAGSIALLLVVLGAIVTGLGTFWTGLRARLLRALPDFPGKSRLPPWAEAP